MIVGVAVQGTYQAVLAGGARTRRRRERPDGQRPGQQRAGLAKSSVNQARHSVPACRRYPAAVTPTALAHQGVPGRGRRDQRARTAGHEHKRRTGGDVGREHRFHRAATPPGIAACPGRRTGASGCVRPARHPRQAGPAGLALPRTPSPARGATRRHHRGAAPRSAVYDWTDPFGRLFLQTLAMVAEFEANIGHLRTREGMAKHAARASSAANSPNCRPQPPAPSDAATPTARCPWPTSPRNTASAAPPSTASSTDPSQTAPLRRSDSRLTQRSPSWRLAVASGVPGRDSCGSYRKKLLVVA
jgi:hypothetical protein